MSICTLDNFGEKDNVYNDDAGIYDLDKSAKMLKRLLDSVIDDIVNDRRVDVNFDRINQGEQFL